MIETAGFIFDMDGVIVDSNPAHKSAIQVFCKNHDQELSEAFLENNIYGRPNDLWIPELFGDISPQRLQELADEKEQLFRDTFQPQNHTVAGIKDFLEGLNRNKIPMALATSAPGDNAAFILERLSLKKYFSAVLDSSDVVKGKPDPEIYIKASNALDKKAENCIIFEDSVSGVQAARTSGAAAVIGLKTTHTTKELADCDLTINDFSKLHLSDIADVL